eukprot:6210533-Pleurochrysis_carterae.AAC.1
MSRLECLHEFAWMRWRAGLWPFVSWNEAAEMRVCYCKPFWMDGECMEAQQSARALSVGSASIAFESSAMGPICARRARETAPSGAPICAWLLNSSKNDTGALFERRLV